MRRMPLGAYLWPGLPQVLQQGDMRWLPAAITAGIALSTMIVATFGWTEWLDRSTKAVVWGAGIVCWITACYISSLRLRRQKFRAESPDRDLQFVDAQQYYLGANWHEAEQVLGDLLQSDPRDVESRLLLATLLRRTDRESESLEQLDILERIEAAAEWRMEIDQERRLAGGVVETPNTTDETNINADDEELSAYDDNEDSVDQIAEIPAEDKPSKTSEAA